MDPEDSMEPLEDETLPVKAITIRDQVDKMFAQSVNLSEGMILHEPTCAVCCSPYREEVEQKYLETKTYGDAIKLFKDRSGNDLHKSILENHMRFHYDRAIREHQKIEYVDRIRRYSGQNLTSLDKLSVYSAILTERIMGVNSVIPAEDESIAEIEKMKSTETARLMGQLKEILKLQSMLLGEMKTSGELISIPTNDFVTIINEALAQAKTDGERQLVKNILGKLDALSRRAQ